MDDAGIFKAVRAIAGRGLTQPEVDVLKRAILSYGDAAAAQQPSRIPFFDTVRRHLEQEEGRIAHAYQDHLGFWTIGVGRLIDRRRGGRLTAAEIDVLLANDIAEKRTAIEAHPALRGAWAVVRDNEARSTALLSMAFQMGVAGLAGFSTTIAMIEAQRFGGAADQMLRSKWASQTPKRARRVAAMIETGRIA